MSTNDTVLGGVSVVYNEHNSEAEIGTYICSACSEPTTYFSLEFGQCYPCDRDLNGCAKCSTNGKCSTCLDGFALTPNGGCFDCSWHSTGCANCTESTCTQCKEGFTTVGGLADNCIAKIF